MFLGRNRGSDTVSRSNFICALAKLGGESDTVKVVREGHWACGWIEWIAIHESDTKALNEARAMIEALKRYPVLNEGHWSELDYNESETCTECGGAVDKVIGCPDGAELCLSCFAAGEH